MAAVQWQFEALDTFFFREAAPFNAGEGGQGGQASVFPPAMSTLQGAIRYQLASCRGWHPGAGNLPPELGDNNDLGDLRLSGPYLYCDKELLLPAPLFLLRLHDEVGKKTSYHRLLPGDPVLCDLDEKVVRLPVMPDGAGGAKPMDNYWLSAATMERVLAGGVPEDDDSSAGFDKPAGCIFANGVAGSDQLWKSEPRVGIELDANSRTAKESNLYAINMIRPKKHVALVVGVDGIPEEWCQSVRQNTNVVNLGGEGKLAGLKITDKQIELPAMPDLIPVKGKVLFTVTLITPGYFGNRKQTQKAIMSLQPWINQTCITACIGKARQIGGWDLSANRPRPLLPFIPSGSTWFFEGDEADIDEIAELHGQYLGERNAYGYGQILIGRWEEKV